jgi:hypothetical protein
LAEWSLALNEADIDAPETRKACATLKRLTIPKRSDPTHGEAANGGNPGAEPGVVFHSEEFQSIHTGKVIRVLCDCVIAADHRYSDWLDLPINAALKRQKSEYPGEVAPCEEYPN